jgi:hypothetical protein
MRKVIYLFSVMVLLIGCTTPLHKAIAPNRENLNKLSIGITKEQALQIMGSTTFVSSSSFFNSFFGSGEQEKAMVINNPYRSEILPVKDKTLEVIYYVTDVKKNDGAITDDELTPLVFDDGKLIGWGQSFLKGYLK